MKVSRHTTTSMHSRVLKTIDALVLAAIASLSIAQNRLLPESFTRTLTTEWSRDGRVIDIKITNPKAKWVVEELTFEISYKPIPTTVDTGFSIDKDSKIRPPLQKSKKEKQTLNLEAALRFIQSYPTTVSNKVTIQPGTSGATHIEMKSDQTVELLDVMVTESRGREQTTFERIKGLAN